MAEELSRSGSPVAGVDSSVDMGSSPKVRQSSNGFTKAKDGAAASTDDRGAMLLFGYDISGLNKTAQVIVLALGGITCALVFASLQEKVFVDKGKKEKQPQSSEAQRVQLALTCTRTHTMFDT